MNPVLLTKSQDNIKASELLINNKFYATSIHCSYYSVYQRLVYTLNCLKTSMNLNISDTHKRSIDAITQELKKQNRAKAEDIEDFTNRITALKSLRKRADYEIKMIIESESRDAFKESKELNKFLFDNIE